MKTVPEGAETRWFISALGAAQICSWGTLFYGFPLIAEAMRTDLGWSKTELYGAATLGMLLAGCAAYPIGAAIDRGHGRILMSGASVVAGLLLAAWSQVSSLPVFYAVLAVLGCMQAATLYEPAFVTNFNTLDCIAIEIHIEVRSPFDVSRPPASCSLQGVLKWLPLK